MAAGYGGQEERKKEVCERRKALVWRLVWEKDGVSWYRCRDHGKPEREREGCSNHPCPLSAFQLFMFVQRDFLKYVLSGIQRLGHTHLLMSSNYDFWGLPVFESRELALKSRSATNRTNLPPTKLAIFPFLCEIEIGILVRTRGRGKSKGMRKKCIIDMK